MGTRAGTVIRKSDPIRVMAMPSSRVAITQVIAEAGVSAMTVSNVLNSRPGASEVTRQRVLEAAARDHHGHDGREECGPRPAAQHAPTDITHIDIMHIDIMHIDITHIDMALSVE